MHIVWMRSWSVQQAVDWALWRRIWSTMWSTKRSDYGILIAECFRLSRFFVLVAHIVCCPLSKPFAGSLAFIQIVFAFEKFISFTHNFPNKPPSVFIGALSIRERKRECASLPGPFVRCVHWTLNGLASEFHEFAFRLEVCIANFALAITILDFTFDSSSCERIEPPLILHCR